MKENILLVGKNGEVEEKLSPIGVKEKIFSEDWLQELLITNPALIPSNEIPT